MSYPAIAQHETDLRYLEDSVTLTESDWVEYWDYLDERAAAGEKALLPKRWKLVVKLKVLV